MIQNPVLPGFNPDPSFLCVGEDYYLATSTFEWYPGVQIFHSRDLVNWDLVSRPLRRAAQLDMRGNPDSCGIWAPCLSYGDGKFWLVYTDVKRFDGAFKDSHNYITCCETIDGDWSDPYYVNSSGFDPSLFHDTDGRTYFVNMRWNHMGPGTGVNPTHDSFDGILLQEWSPEAGLFGPVKNIYPGTVRGLTEAPHLFKRAGYYYLTTAEGGTGYDHAVSLARSRDIWGPYEDHPDLHVICAADAPDSPIQRTGHGQFIEAHTGELYHSFLMGRPMAGPDGTGRYCPMGRETGLERLVWGDDDWPRLEAGGLVVRPSVPGGAGGLGAATPRPRAAVSYDFATGLPADFQWLRTPFPERLMAFEGRGMTLIGRESIGSWYEQSLVARRQEDHVYVAETTVDVTPDTYQVGAGLTTYYNRFKFHAIWVTLVGDAPALVIGSCLGDVPFGNVTYALNAPLPVAPGPIELRVSVDHARQQFWYRQGGDWVRIGPELDASLITDEGGYGEHGSFTGAFVGPFAFDITGRGTKADFARFSYAPDVKIT